MPQEAVSTYCRQGCDKSGQLSAGVTGTRHRVPRQHGQQKEHTGFLVSRSLTLLFHDFPSLQEKKNHHSDKTS